jgi:RNA polymerase sigma factor (TIGR02999 family)
MGDRDQITEVLLRAADGSPAAVDQLFALVYGELRKMARAYLRSERDNHTLQATELIHEAYLRMVDQTRCEWRSRAHFLAIAGMAMRRILIDHARRRGRQKRGGEIEKLSLDDPRVLDLGSVESDSVLLALEGALDKLERSQPEMARVVVMRFFAGLTHEECAGILDVSPRTVARQWEYAQAWLYREMTTGPGPDGTP